MSKRSRSLSLLLSALLWVAPASAGAIRTIAGFQPTSLPKGDDISTAAVPIGFSLNFLGKPNSTVYVNTNGNITFGAPFDGYPGQPDNDQAGGIVPPINSSTIQLISGFLADIDATPPAVGTITYGTTTINGRAAFVATYTNVTFFSFDPAGYDTKRNSFQIILLDRSDTGTGNFDIELNYDQVQWESADSNGGTNGLGGYTAQVGYTNGSLAAGTFFELTGSEVPGAFLDGGPQSLVTGSLNSGGVAGRYVFAIRNTATATVSSLSPSSAPAGGAGFTMTVNGTGFAANSNILWNGSLLPGTFVSSTQLTATVAAGLIATQGTASVTVSTNNVTSNAVTFTITGASGSGPVVSGLNPSSAQAGSGSFALSVNGSGFASNSSILWNGSPIPTSFASAGQLNGTVAGSLIATAGTANVSVSSNGATSNAVSFTITPASSGPSVSSIFPSSAQAGGPAFSLTVNGAGFASNSTILWNGAPLATTFGGPTQLNGSVSANLINSQGSATVAVSTNGSVSNGVSFTISSPVTAPPPPPVALISNLSPSSAQAGGAAFSLTVNGSRFSSGSTILWNGSALATIFGNTNQLIGTVNANLIANQGTVTISVTTNGAVSNTAFFIITPPTPTLSITGLIPAAAQAGGQAISLTVNGAGFTSSSTVVWNGTSLATTFVNGTQLTATVGASLIATQGAATVFVTGGGVASNSLTFTIAAPTAAATISGLSPWSAQAGGPGFTLTITGFAFTENSAVLWNDTPLLTTFVNSKQLKVAVATSLITSPGTASVTVSSGSTVTSASTFTITDPPPAAVLTSLSPSSIVTGSQSFTLTVSGSGFTANSGFFQTGTTILWNGTAIPTTFVNSTQLTAIIDATLIGPQRTVTVSVTSSANSLPFSVQGIKGQQISLFPTEMNFTARADGPIPIPSNLSVWSKGSVVKFHVAGSTGSWLDVNSSAGQTNQGVSVSARTSGISPGGYRGELLVQNDASSELQKIPVSLTVLPPSVTQLDIAPLSQTIEVSKDSGPVKYNLIVANAGGGKLSFIGQTLGGNWLSLQTTNGNASPSAPSSLSYTIDPSGLAKGIYDGALVVTDIGTNQRLTARITLVVSERPKPVTVSQTAMEFAVTTQQVSARRDFTIRNNSAVTTVFSVESETSSGGDWLGTTPPYTLVELKPGASSKVSVLINPQGIAADRYFGVIRIKTGPTGESVQTLPVLLTVRDDPSAAGGRLAQSGVTIVGAPGAVATTKIDVSNQTATPLDFSSVAGMDWLTIKPSSGTIAPYSTISVDVTADSTKASAGIRNDVVRFPFSDGGVSTLNVVSITRAATGCNPSSLAVQLTSLEPGFAIPDGGVATIQARVYDSCGNPRTTGTLIANISSEANPVLLTSEDDGLWSGSWSPSKIQRSVVVTVSAASDQGASALTGQTTLAGSVVDVYAGAAPLIDHAANAASYQTGGQIAPGSWVSIFGDQLASSQVIGQGPPYPTELGGTRVTLGGVRLPLLFVDPRQLNVFIPFQVRPNTLQQLVIERQGAVSIPVNVKIGDTVPGIYTSSQSGSGQGAIVFSGSKDLAAPAPLGRPARRGDPLEIYATGLGLVENQPEDQTASLTQLSRTVNPVTITIGGVSTQAQFAGLTPGFVGLYQVNLQAPNDAPSGAAVPLTISINGKESNTVTIAIQ